MNLPDSISSLHPIDALVLAFIGYHGLMGVVRGFAFQCVRLATWIVAIAVTRHYSDSLVAKIQSFDATLGDASARAIALLSIVIGTLLVGLLVMKLTKKLIESWKLASADRVLGCALGVTKAIAIVLIVMSLVTRVAPALGFSETLAATQTARTSAQLLQTLGSVLPAHLVEDYQAWLEAHAKPSLEWPTPTVQEGSSTSSDSGK